MHPIPSGGTAPRTSRRGAPVAETAGYPEFRAAVAQAQLTSWLPASRGLLLDISGPGARTADIAACAGHRVLRVTASGTAAPAGLGSGLSSSGASPGAALPGAASPGGRVAAVAAEDDGLAFLPDGCADGVIAEEGTLSRHLAAEDLTAEIARVLRPGGQLLACVDSLTSGMAVLAEQHRWPSLVDVLNADVVLIPWPDGTITRCYGAEQLRELLTGAGLEVSWIRPRTVLSPQTVSYLLERDPATFAELVKAELRARADDSVGTQLIACAVRP